MIQLPYRDGDRMEVGGGDLPDYTLLPNDELIVSSNDDTSEPGNYTSPDLNRKKINRKSYKTELKAMTKERDWYKKDRLKWMIACFVMLAGMIAFTIWTRI